MKKEKNLTNEQILRKNNFSKEQFEEMRKCFIKPAGKQVIQLKELKSEYTGECCVAIVINDEDDFLEVATYLLKVKTDEVYAVHYTIHSKINAIECNVAYVFPDLGCIKGNGADIVDAEVVYSFNSFGIHQHVTGKKPNEIFEFIKGIFPNTPEYFKGINVFRRIINTDYLGLMSDPENFQFGNKKPDEESKRNLNSLQEKLQEKKIGKNWSTCLSSYSSPCQQFSLTRFDEAGNSNDMIVFEVVSDRDKIEKYNLYLRSYKKEHYDSHLQSGNDYKVELTWNPEMGLYFVELAFKYSKLSVSFPIFETEEANVIKVLEGNYKMLISQWYNELESNMCVCENHISLDK